MRKSQIFTVIEKLSDKYPVIVTCKFYNVSSRGYYDWKMHQGHKNPDAELIKMIEECRKQHKNRYGYRRIALWLKREKGLIINKKKVLRITGRNNLLSVTRRRKILKFKPNGNLKYENILNRNFSSDMPNEKWVSLIKRCIYQQSVIYAATLLWRTEPRNGRTIHL